MVLLIINLGRGQPKENGLVVICSQSSSAIATPSLLTIILLDEMSKWCKKVDRGGRAVSLTMRVIA
jgi:hypothetical protein